jgi:hypothetical protein
MKNAAPSMPHAVADRRFAPFHISSTQLHRMSQCKGGKWKNRSQGFFVALNRYSRASRADDEHVAGSTQSGHAPKTIQFKIIPLFLRL